MCKVSIITVNLNNKIGLQRTIKSVLSQTYTDFEYLIFDGKSDDGSVEVIESYSTQDLWWISEKDTGIYNAMNKGIRKAKGEYLLFLNAGDYFLNENSLLSAFGNNFKEDIVYCDVKSIGTDEIIHFPSILNFSFFLYATINHQATFIKRQLFFDYGFYNENFEIVSDWEFFIKCIFLKNASTKHLPLVLIEFDFNYGKSALSTGKLIIKKERAIVLENDFKRFLNDYDKMHNLKIKFEERMNSSIRIPKSFVASLRSIRKRILQLSGKWK